MYILAKHWLLMGWNWILNHENAIMFCYSLFIQIKWFSMGLVSKQVELSQAAKPCKRNDGKKKKSSEIVSALKVIYWSILKRLWRRTMNLQTLSVAASCWFLIGQEHWAQWLPQGHELCPGCQYRLSSHWDLKQTHRLKSLWWLLAWGAVISCCWDQCLIRAILSVGRPGGGMSTVQGRAELGVLWVDTVTVGTVKLFMGCVGWTWAVGGL